MKKYWKRAATAALALTMAASVLAGCGGDGKNASKGKLPELTEERYTLDAAKPAWQMDKKESTELTWYVNASWWNTEWANDVVTKKIKEDLNLDVKFITGDDTKLNTFFAGEDMPDLITLFDPSSQAAKSAANWAYSLNDLADKYDPYFYNVASKDSLNWYQLDDGKTYGYPDYSNSQKDYDDGYIQAATAFAVRKDVYEAIGSPSMGTPEEFTAALTKIKEQFPDLIPFGFNSMQNSTGSLGGDFQNFIGVPIENADGTFYDRNVDEDYLAWIKTFNKVYNEGLISDDSFADDGTAYEEKIKIGQYATLMIGGTPQRSGALQIWKSSNPGAEYIAIDGPQSTVGNAPALSQAGLSGWMINYITKDCSDPIKAIEVFTYLISDEGGILTTYGIEGETYEVNADGKYALLPAVKEMKEKENDRFKKEYRLSEFILFGHDRYQINSADSAESSIAQMQEWGKGKMKTQFVLENTNPDQGSTESRNLSAIDTNWNTTLVSMIRAKDEAELTQILEDHKKFRQDNSWDKIVEVKNEKMQANREKLGLK